MSEKKLKYQTNTDDSVQHILKIKKELKRNSLVKNYNTVKKALSEVDYDDKTLEKDKWFLDLIIAKIKSDNNKSTYQFIMNIVYSVLIALFGLDILSTEPFVVNAFLCFPVVLIGLALHSIITDFQNSMLLEILTMIKNSGKIGIEAMK